MLKRRGIHRVRPLIGGLDEWISLGYPTEDAAVEINADKTDWTAFSENDH